MGLRVLRNTGKTFFFRPLLGRGLSTLKLNAHGLDQIDPLHTLLLLGLGLVASIINVVAGGGSYLTLPALIFTGLSPGMANGTNRIGILAGNLFSAVKFARLGQLRVSDLLYFCLPATLGGLVGAWVATQIDDRSLRVVLAVFMLFGSWTVIGRPPQTQTQTRNPNWSFPMFSGVGLYAGFIQAGTGFFSLAATSFLGYDLKRGNAVKTLMNLCLTVPALFVFWRQSLVDWPSGVALAVGMSLGGLIGVHVSETAKHESLKKMVAGAILISAFFIVYPLIRAALE